MDRREQGIANKERGSGSKTKKDGDTGNGSWAVAQAAPREAVLKRSGFRPTSYPVCPKSLDADDFPTRFNIVADAGVPVHIIQKGQTQRGIGFVDTKRA